MYICSFLLFCSSVYLLYTNCDKCKKNTNEDYVNFCTVTNKVDCCNFRNHYNKQKLVNPHIIKSAKNKIRQPSATFKRENETLK